MKGWQKMAMVLILAAFMLALVTVLTSTASADSAPASVDVSTGQITGLKFEDVNTNGVLDPGVDYPVANWTIYLWSTDNGLPCDLLLTTHTLASGEYCFDNVAPGTYIVSEELRTGWKNITPSSELITVESGWTTTVDFGNVELGKIVVWKYYDWNMNGVFDGGDETMKGWSFSVYDAQGTELKTVTTNAYGENVFYDLVVGGTYEVREALQDGWFNTTPANQWVTINRCGDAQVMFGNIELGTISGYKYNDLDMDQAKDENENGLAGWTIELYLNDVFVKSTITDESGAYCFEDLKPGNYDVREVMQKDWFNVSPTEADVEVVPSGEYTADFYNVHGGYIDGYKFYDYNINGRWDENSNELGLAGWTIEAVMDGQVIATTVTGADGSYHFCLRPGTYTIREVLQTGWYNSTVSYLEVSIEPCSEQTVNFGNIDGGWIWGYKFYDRNNDGLWNDHECGVLGWDISLYKDGDFVKTVATSENGCYAFGVLAPGVYEIVEESVAGWFNNTPSSVTVTVELGKWTEQSFGNVRAVYIEGYKFHDLNMNGEWDADESAVADYPVYLYKNNAFFEYTVTDATGYYCFTERPGTYTVQEGSQPAIWFNVTPDRATVTLCSSERTNVTFGNAQYASVLGTKFLDLDMDGVFDPTEASLPGWTITLMKGDEKIAETVTDEWGDYEFVHLIPGAYTVTETAKAGWANITPFTVEINLASGENRELNFGNVKLGDIGACKFYDMNMDGVYNLNEEGLVFGWTFYLYSANDLTTPLDIKNCGDCGCVTFQDLMPGDYVVIEEIRAGWFNITPDRYTVHLESGQFIKLTFGNVEGADIFGYKFHDANMNGVWDTDEDAIPEYPIDLYKDGVYKGTTYTNADGYYVFNDVLPGTYVVKEQKVCGYFNVTSSEVTRTVGPDGEANATFGNAMYASVVGYKFYDENLNGVWDCQDDIECDSGPSCFRYCECGLAGWTIQLWQGDVLVDETVTDECGYFEFTGLIPGEYTVKEVMQSGWFNVLSKSIDVVLYSGDNGVYDLYLDFVYFGNAQYGVIEGYKIGVLCGDNQAPACLNLGCGLAGWTIQLWQNGQLINTTVTDADGKYRFDDVYPGLWYEVSEVMQDQWFNIFPIKECVYVSSGEVETVYFVNAPTATVSGYKFEDCNMNGRMDVEEQGLSGWTIELRDLCGRLVNSTVTDENGYYEFTNVLPGFYCVKEVAQDGWKAITCSSYQFCAFIDSDIVRSFGNVKLGDIVVKKFYDRNMDGIMQDDEELLSGFTFVLKDAVTGRIVDCATTGECGCVVFHNVLPGTYIVKELDREGYYNITNVRQTVVLNCGGYETVLFGNVEGGSIEGYKFYDTNMNGVWDAGEQPIAGWHVEISGRNDGRVVSMTATTDRNGYYSFNNLYPGSYEVWEWGDENYFATTADDVLTDVYPGEPTNVTFGNAEYASIAGYKFYDVNMNGVWDEGEMPVAYWGIYLYDAEENYEGFVLTDTNGRYCFNHLMPGAYTVDEEIQYWWFNVTAYTVDVMTEPGKCTPVNFGNAMYGEVWVVKYYDYNMNGVKDCEEEGLEGWTMKLYDASGKFLASGETDSDGEILFTYLPPGTYYVEEVPQAGWFNVTPDSQPVTIVAGEVADTAYFGNAEYAYIYVYKFFDSNGNGQWDENEYGIEDWRFQLTFGKGTYTIGYWKNHDGSGPQADEVSGLIEQAGGIIWLGTPYGVDSVAITTAAQAHSYLEKLGDASNGINRLYAQLLAAKLNILVGADGSAVTTVISGSDTFLASHSSGSWSSLTAGQKADVGAWASTLDDYNNGVIGPGHGDGSSTTIYGHSNETGVYCFRVIPGKYVVSEVIPKDGQDWFATTPTSVVVSVNPGESKDVVFGNVPLGSICGVKFADSRGDGMPQRAEDGPLEGWTIQLWNADKSVLLGTDVTNNCGEYCFEHLLPGDYVITEVQKAGFYNTSALFIYATLEAGEHLEGQLFGNARFGDVHGNVFVDGNGNNVFDSGVDQPLAGWTVQLWNADETVLLGSLTSGGPRGGYLFENVRIGDYVVKVVAPSEWDIVSPASVPVHVAYGSSNYVGFTGQQVDENAAASGAMLPGDVSPVYLMLVPLFLIASGVALRARRNQSSA